MDVPEPLPLTGIATEIVEVTRPTRDEQAQLWTNHLGQQRSPQARQLATQFQLPLPALSGVIARTASVAAHDHGESGGEIWNACLAAARVAPLLR